MDKDTYSDSIIFFILYWIMTLIVVFFVVGFAFFWVNTKDTLCVDFGNKIYGRPLTFFECLTL